MIILLTILMYILNKNFLPEYFLCENWSSIQDLVGESEKNSLSLLTELTSQGYINIKKDKKEKNITKDFLEEFVGVLDIPLFLLPFLYFHLHNSSQGRGGPC